MKVIVTIDDQKGMMFNHRRQSRDSLLIKDILNTCGDAPLYMNSYSSSLFKDNQHIIVNDMFLDMVKEDYCFVENLSLHSYINYIDELIVYKWNRKYPADFFLDIDLNEWELISCYDFQGSSHDTITKEIYRRKK